MFKVKRLDDGLWYVLVFQANRVWTKNSEKGYQTAEEAEQALCRQLDADAAAQHEGLNSSVKSQFR
jgi:hypothetical protein